jgi:hypothetical protein
MVKALTRLRLAFNPHGYEIGQMAKRTRRAERLLLFWWKTDAGRALDLSEADRRFLYHVMR